MDVLRSIGKQSGESVESVLKKLWLGGHGLGLILAGNIWKYTMKWFCVKKLKKRFFLFRASISDLVVACLRHPYTSLTWIDPNIKY